MAQETTTENAPLFTVIHPELLAEAQASWLNKQIVLRDSHARGEIFMDTFSVLVRTLHLDALKQYSGPQDDGRPLQPGEVKRTVSPEDDIQTSGDEQPSVVKSTARWLDRGVERKVTIEYEYTVSQPTRLAITSSDGLYTEIEDPSWRISTNYAFDVNTLIGRDPRHARFVVDTQSRLAISSAPQRHRAPIGSGGAL